MGYLSVGGMCRWDNRACVYACVYVVIMHVCVLCMCICVLCLCCVYVCGKLCVVCICSMCPSVCYMCVHVCCVICIVCVCECASVCRCVRVFMCVLYVVFHMCTNRYGFCDRSLLSSLVVAISFSLITCTTHTYIIKMQLIKF